MLMELIRSASTEPTRASTFSHLTDNAEGDTRAQTLPDAVKGDDVLTMMGKADTEQAKIQ
jgi:hypothetical protein